MPDPVTLPYELWTWCIAHAIDGREAGPLELLAVSRRWESLLLDTPSLWNQIYIQNGEDEIARISVFLQLSRRCSLHVDTMTALPTLDSLQLLANHVSRVTTITIRPGLSDNITALHMERWKKAASHILARFSNGPLALDVQCTSCFGVSLWENNSLYYCIALMEFTTKATVKGPNKPNGGASAELPETEYLQRWEEHITRTARTSADQDATARTTSIGSIVRLASHGILQQVMIAFGIAKSLLEDNDRSVQFAAIEALEKFAIRTELRETLGLANPSIIKLLGHKNSRIVKAAVSLIGQLAKHVELFETLGLAIPLLISLIGHGVSGVRSATVSLIGKLAEHVKLREKLRLAIPWAIEMLKSWDSNVRDAAVTLLGTLAKYSELHEAVRITIPSVINLLGHRDLGVQSAAISLLENLAEYDDFRDAVRVQVADIDNWEKIRLTRR